MLNDPLVQAAIVGTFANASGAVVALLLWNQLRGERYLLFWGLFWTLGTLRWAMHMPALGIPPLRMLEWGLIIPTMFFFVALGAYDLLPTRPWKNRTVVATTGVLMLAYGVVSNASGEPVQMGYGLAAAAYLLSAAGNYHAYRVTRLSGHAIAAGAFLGWGLYFIFGLSAYGRDITRSVIAPLFNFPVALALVTIAFQRRGRELEENERTLQKIFETAPTPIVILRPPNGEIERANAAALDLLGVSPGAALGRTAFEQGLVTDSPARRALYSELQSGRRVSNREVAVMRGGSEERTVSINADRIALESGERIIVSIYDLTELRAAQAELQFSWDQMRQLYVRLANVEDEERRALHAELHDQVGANLSALRLEIDVATTLLDRGDAAGARRELGGAREIAIETMAMARDLMAELRPPALDDYGLVAALRSHAEAQASRLHLAVLVEGGDLAPRPTRVVEGALFRIAHEALANAARHAGAREVVIRVEARGDTVVLAIEDDGVGFDPAAPASGPDHWGLKNMRERAVAIGGTLQIESAPGAGTRVVAEVPRGGS